MDEVVSAKEFGELKAAVEKMQKDIEKLKRQANVKPAVHRGQPDRGTIPAQRNT